MAAARPRTWGLVSALPRRATSRAFGVLAGTRLPSFFLAPLLRVYARAFGVDRSEMTRKFGAYSSFQDFFTRRLVGGARPQPDDPATVTSPADGRVHGSGEIRKGCVLQAKGQPYAVGELLGEADGARDLDGGTWLVIHLAPGDYHRFHWPFDGTVETVRHVPGDLWPVHAGAMAVRPRLLPRNERVVLRGRTGTGAPFALVAIGALHVGSIRFASFELRTNRGGTARPRVFRPTAWTGRRGDDLGHFEMGSSIALLLGPGAGRLDPPPPGDRLRVGLDIGRLADSAARPEA